MRNYYRLFLRVFSFSLLFTPILLESFTGLGVSAKKTKTKPATEEDVFLYRGIGGTFICNARNAEVEFPKAVGIATATYVSVLEGKHDGKVKSVGKNKLTREKLFAGAEFQLVTAAIQFCPEQVPNDVKEKVKTVIDKEMGKSKKK